MQEAELKVRPASPCKLMENKIKFCVQKAIGADKMAQWAKERPAKLGNMSLIPRSTRKEGRTNPTRWPLTSIHLLWLICGHVYKTQ